MTYLSFILRHLQHSALRSVSTALGVALSIFLFCTLQTVLARVDGAIEARNPRRLVTTNVAEMLALPPSRAARIARIPGVKRVARLVMFGGFLRGTREGREPGKEPDWTTFFQNLAVDAAPYFAMNPELTVSAEQFRDFMADRSGCVIGSKLAARLGWGVGDHFFLESLASGLRKPDGPYEFAIRGLIESDAVRFPDAETDVMIFHFEYLEATLGPAARPSLYMVEVDDPARAAAVAGAIDAAFENSADPTFTQTEDAFLADLMSMLGDIPSLLNGLGAAVCFAILLVTANTMGMAARERRTEVAVLKTLGFTHARLSALILAEALILTGVGGAVGLAATETVLWLLEHRHGLILPGVATLELRPGVALSSFAVALLLGVAAGAMPAWGAYRAKISDMLRPI